MWYCRYVKEVYYICINNTIVTTHNEMSWDELIHHYVKKIYYININNTIVTTHDDDMCWDEFMLVETLAVTLSV